MARFPVINARTLLRMENKDSERFAVYLEVLQTRVAWSDRILLHIQTTSMW